MKFKLIIIFALSAYVCSAQYNSVFSNFERMGRSVSVNGEFEMGSNGIYNGLLNKFIFGGYIDNKTKDASRAHMKNLNVAGTNMNYDVSVFFGRHPKYSYLIGFKDQRTFNAAFTKDFYDLMFYGNKPFKGEVKNLSGSNVNSLRFQEIKMGFIWHKIDSTAKVGVSVSFLKGQQLFYIKTKEGSSLYTSADGKEIVFNSDFTMALSDTSNRKNPFAYTGIGASADIFFETPYKGKLGKGSVLTVNANNIGFLHWFDNSVQYSSDSTFKFNGYKIDNILDLKDTTLANINRDSIIRVTTNAHRESFNVNIPTNLLIINKIRFTNKFVLGVGYRYLFNSNFKPYFFTDFEYQLTPKLFTAMHVAYGGYTRLNVGASIIYNTPQWFFKFGSNSLQGYIAPKKTYGTGLFITVAKKFKR